MSNLPPTPSAGDLVREAREFLNLSREAVAAQVGTSVSTIVRLELEDRLPATVTTARICAVLHLSMDKLAAAALTTAS